jgi:hypothetical protein
MLPKALSHGGATMGLPELAVRGAPRSPSALHSCAEKNAKFLIGAGFFGRNAGLSGRRSH